MNRKVVIILRIYKVPDESHSIHILLYDGDRSLSLATSMEDHMTESHYLMEDMYGYRPSSHDQEPAFFL